MITALQETLAGLLGTNVDWKQVLLAGATPFFLLAFVVEWRGARRRGQQASFQWKEILANVALGSAYQVAEALAWVLATGAIFSWVYQHRLWTIAVNGWTVLPIFVLFEACYYCFHRSSHRVRWWWAAHVPHHSGETMNFSTAARQSVLNVVVGSFIFYVPPVWLGVPPAVVMFMLAVDLVYQYFVHTEAIGTLPRWYEAIFNTPSHHRVHHGRNRQYIDKNYGGVLIIFDRLFGTFAEEKEKVEYGIPRQIRSYNFLVLNLHELVDLLRDVAAPGPLRQRLRHLWMPPDWQRPGHVPRHTWTVERRDAAAEQAPP
ncbi:sterol desaturase family protein [Massilia sp. PWRC2]|uniref:sterol desaturase family protein n=1 Tax=Massilia sp. PWRC2 TaxID=2804626 RepID=UPI003CF075E5